MVFQGAARKKPGSGFAAGVAGAPLTAGPLGRVMARSPGPRRAASCVPQPPPRDRRRARGCGLRRRRAQPADQRRARLGRGSGPLAASRRGRRHHRRARLLGRRHPRRGVLARCPDGARPRDDPHRRRAAAADRGGRFRRRRFRRLGDGGLFRPEGARRPRRFPQPLPRAQRRGGHRHHGLARQCRQGPDRRRHQRRRAACRLARPEPVRGRDLRRPLRPQEADRLDRRDRPLQPRALRLRAPDLQRHLQRSFQGPPVGGGRGLGRRARRVRADQRREFRRYLRLPYAEIHGTRAFRPLGAGDAAGKRTGVGAAARPPGAAALRQAPRWRPDRQFRRPRARHHAHQPRPRLHPDDGRAGGADAAHALPRRRFRARSRRRLDAEPRARRAGSSSPAPSPTPRSIPAPTRATTISAP